VIYADRMYYDVPNQMGTVLRAELLTTVPRYQGSCGAGRCAPALDRDHFFAQDASITPAGWATRPIGSRWAIYRWSMSKSHGSIRRPASRWSIAHRRTAHRAPSACHRAE